MTFHRSLRGVTVGLIALGALAVSAVSSLAFTGEQVPLDTAKVEAVIASLPEIKATAEALSQKYGDDDAGDDLASSWSQLMAYGDAQSSLNGVVQKHGFADFQTWVQTFSSVAMAHAFAKDDVDVDAGLAEALAEIRNNDALTDEQKQMLSAQMEASFGAIAGMRPSQQNLDAVSPFGAQLDALLDD